MKRRWTIAVIGLLAVAVIWLVLGGFGGRVPVHVAVVQRGPIRTFIDEQAKTRLPQTYLMTMPLAGRIEPITLEEGARVSKGQIVAQIVPADLQLEVDQAQAAVARLEAAIAEASDTRVERTAQRQAAQFVKSTGETVKAAWARVLAAKAKLEYAESFFRRVADAPAAVAATDYEAALLGKVQSTLELHQDQFVHAALLAVQTATDMMPTLIAEYIDRKDLTAEVLRRQKQEAELRLCQALRDQQRGQMRSPVDGVVLKRFVSDERFLGPGTPLLEIGQMEQMEVEAEILTTDAVTAQVGAAVEIYGPAVGPIPARGTVARIYPAAFTKLSALGVEQQRVIVVIRIDADDLRRLLDQRRLGVGYSVRVRIITAEKADALIVPRSALFRAVTGQWQVFVVQRGVARLRDVQLGLVNDEQAEVLAGLEEGQSVILSPESSLSDGTGVRT